MLSVEMRSKILKIRGNKPLIWSYFATQDTEFFNVCHEHRQDCYLEFRVWEQDSVTHVHCNKTLSGRKLAGVESVCYDEPAILQVFIEYIYFGFGGIM